MLKPILNYIAKHHPKTLTETWLNQTEQGKLYRNRHKEPVTKLDLRGKAKAFIDSLPESGWRTTGSPLPFGLRLTGYDLIQQDREILILVHNDKSDIYGVFEKINENRFPVLLDILTAPVERVSAQTISDIEEKLKGIRNDLSEDPVTVAGIAHALHTVALLNKDVKGLLTEPTNSNNALLCYCGHSKLMHSDYDGCILSDCQCKLFALNPQLTIDNTHAQAL